MKFLVFALLFALVFCGCTQSQMTVGWYAIEGVGYTAYDRAIRSNDVVLVKGIDGRPNILCMRRGRNKLWGPSENLSRISGLGFWNYTENNRRIQIYENIGVAMNGKYKFEMTPEAQKEWNRYQKWMDKKFPTQIDYVMYEHLLKMTAQINESVSELKQEKYMFKHRND